MSRGQHERDLGLDPRLAAASASRSGRRRPVADVHVVEQVAEVGLVDARAGSAPPRRWRRSCGRRPSPRRRAAPAPDPAARRTPPAGRRCRSGRAPARTAPGSPGPSPVAPRRPRSRPGRSRRNTRTCYSFCAMSDPPPARSRRGRRRRRRRRRRRDDALPWRPRSSGLDTVLLEKSAYFGGSTARSGGGVWIPGNYALKAAGQDDDLGAVQALPRLDRRRRRAEGPPRHLPRPRPRGHGLHQGQHAAALHLGARLRRLPPRGARRPARGPHRASRSRWTPASSATSSTGCTRSTPRRRPT